MSGHSKWAKIKRKKAVTDSKRGANFSKISKEIIVAAKLGGPDPGANYRLRFAIDKAKAVGFPAANIERAIEKGSGSGKDSDSIEEIIYEGYGPGGAAILVLATTDNKNRTVQDIRSYFSKYDGNLAQAGAVAWMFDKCGEIKVSSKSQDEAYELAIEAGAEDVEFSEEDNSALILTKSEELEKVQKNLVSKGIQNEDSRLTYRPKETLKITDAEQASKLIKLLDIIEEHDDVQNIFSNFDIDDEVLQTID